MADASRMRWKELSGEARWQVLEQARRREVPMRELCQRFGITRQTLHRLRQTADQAAMQALEPRRAGRKKKPASEAQMAALKEELTQQQKELDRWRQKYEVTKTLLGLERKLNRGEPLPGERKKKGGRTKR